MPVPQHPKIYHILHVDRLPSIIADEFLCCDARMCNQPGAGTIIGMNNIKQRRLTLPLHSHPGLHVGDCVPFYFCPRSIMLYLLWQGNHCDLEYRDGQQPIIHLQADLHETVQWAQQNKLRFAFTSSNAGSYYFEDWHDLNQLHNIDWDAVNATDWSKCKEGKQAEFLLENRFPWELVECIGVYSDRQLLQVNRNIAGIGHRPVIEVKRAWYY